MKKTVEPLLIKIESLAKNGLLDKKGRFAADLLKCFILLLPLLYRQTVALLNK